MLRVSIFLPVNCSSGSISRPTPDGFSQAEKRKRLINSVNKPLLWKFMYKKNFVQKLHLNNCFELLARKSFVTVGIIFEFLIIFQRQRRYIVAFNKIYQFPIHIFPAYHHRIGIRQSAFVQAVVVTTGV